MLVNNVFKPVPHAVAPPMIATEIRAAIRPYSIAVAPDSFFTKRAISFILVLLAPGVSHLLSPGLSRLTENNLQLWNLNQVNTQPYQRVNFKPFQIWLATG